MKPLVGLQGVFEMKKPNWEKEFENRVYQFIVGILGQYGKPLKELSELQQALLQKDAEQLVRGVLYEASKVIRSQVRQEARDEGYKEGARVQAGMDAETIKKARQDAVEEERQIINKKIGEQNRIILSSFQMNQMKKKGGEK